MPIVGQTGLNGLVAFSPWFKRPESATAGIFSAYSIQMTSGSGIELEVALYHRNSEDTDSGSQVGSATSNSIPDPIIKSVIVYGSFLYGHTDRYDGSTSRCD